MDDERRIPDLSEVKGQEKVKVKERVRVRVQGLEQVRRKCCKFHC